MKTDEPLPRHARLRSSKYLNSLIEQDHRHNWHCYQGTVQPSLTAWLTAATAQPPADFAAKHRAARLRLPRWGELERSFAGSLSALAGRGGLS
jgi:hypothetical protein